MGSVPMYRVFSQAGRNAAPLPELRRYPRHVRLHVRHRVALLEGGALRAGG